MRNWNLNSEPQPDPDCRFQTTYEELKLKAIDFAEETTQGFQTTYEELKRSGIPERTPPNPLPDYLWGIETLADRRVVKRV